MEIKLYVIYKVGDVNPIFKVVLSLFFIIAIIILFAFFSLAGVIPSLNISWRETKENPRNSKNKTKKLTVLKSNTYV